MLPISPHDIRFVLAIVESLNPLSYHGLKHRNIIENSTYILSLVFACLVISTAIMLPFGIGTFVNSDLGRFSSISVDYELAEGEPRSDSIFGIRYFGFGDSSALLNVKEDGVEANGVLCASFRLFCRAGNFIPKDSLGDPEVIAGSAGKLILFMLPGLFILAMVFHLLRYFLIIAASSIVALVIGRLFKFELNLYSSFAVSAYSSTALIIPELLVPSLGIDTLGLEWLLFAVLFIAGLICSADRMKGEKHGRGRGSEDKQSGKGAA